MKIIIECPGKEIAELALELQAQQRGVDASTKFVLGTILKKFCDDFDLHDEETDSLLEKLIKG